jgi:hypothetical protein
VKFLPSLAFNCNPSHLILQEAMITQVWTTAAQLGKNIF